MTDYTFPTQLEGDFTGAAEMVWIRDALRENLYGGRAWVTAVPDDVELPLDEDGTPKPYYILSFATPFASTQGRNIAGGEKTQPHVLSFSVTAWAGSADDARDAMTEASRLLVDEQPSLTSGQIKARGGTMFDEPAKDQRPTRYASAGFFRVVVNA